jgi:hypothetical protein
MSVCEMSPRCSTCKWWGGNPHILDYKNGLCVDECQPTDSVEIPHKTCGSPKIVDTSDGKWDQIKALPLDAAWYSDREDYGARFRTGPDFGCVHWEEKE